MDYLFPCRVLVLTGRFDPVWKSNIGRDEVAD
jgi:hypothetical protein